MTYEDIKNRAAVINRKVEMMTALANRIPATKSECDMLASIVWEIITTGRKLITDSEEQFVAYVVHVTTTTKIMERFKDMKFVYPLSEKILASMSLKAARNTKKEECMSLMSMCILYCFEMALKHDPYSSDEYFGALFTLAKLTQRSLVVLNPSNPYADLLLNMMSSIAKIPAKAGLSFSESVNIIENHNYDVTQEWLQQLFRNKYGF